jgi:hypothetical protein
LRGRASGGGGIVFNLPAGYGCPAPLLRFTTSCETSAGSYTGQGRCYVSGGSVVIDFAPANSQYHDLSAVEFDTATVTAMPTGPTGPPGPAAVITPSDAFHIVGAAGEPAYKNAWTALDTRGARFRKYKDGIVRLSGAMNVGTISTAAFTLPSGYRPAVEGYYPVIANGVHGGVIVGVNGDVIPFAPMAAGYCFVAGIQFDTEGGS